MKKYTHEKAHEEIDYIFKTLLPQRGMAERPEQIRLCHSILDAMLDGSIALCDAGTGIGKTFAYLTAGILHGKCRAAEGKPQRPILISTSSIALQSAIQKEYLPLLSSVLLSEGLISAPIEAVIRKGKAHYACDARLERRVRQVEGSHKNPAARQALHTAWHVLDLDQLSGMSSYDRERICVPKRCNCRRTADTAVSWTPARAGSTRFRSATTTSCWRTSSTAAKRKSPSCRTARPSS